MLEIINGISKMCTRPITITKTYPLIGTRSYTIPCGKCAECINKKRNELAALSVIESQKSSNVHFFTFTYRDECLPIAISEDTPDGVCLLGFERGAAAIAPSYKDMGDKFVNRVCEVASNHVYNAGSLCREDIKKVLKQFRVNWKRSFPSESLDFKYCVFGEYGDRSGRPHYHGLFWNLSQHQAEFLSSIWNQRFGFVKFIPDTYRKLGVDEQIAISKYVSKYISKGINQRFAHLLPYVEKPRRQSSINLGIPDNLESLSDFITGAILSNLDALMTSLCYHPVGNLSTSMGVYFPFRQI